MLATPWVRMVGLRPLGAVFVTHLAIDTDTHPGLLLDFLSLKVEDTSILFFVVNY